MNIIDAISNSCNCEPTQAEEYLQDEINVLRDYIDLDDFRNSDVENACSNLGIDMDYASEILEMLI